MLLATAFGIPAQERERRLDAPGWADLPFEWALTTKRGAGRRQIAVFSDPNCPFCRRFERDLAGLDDLTVHVFMYPVLGPDSLRLTRAVWCSRDRVKAWNDLMHKRIEPAQAPECDAPIGKLGELGRRLGVRYTPTWLLPSGEMYPGAMRLTELVPLLDAGQSE